jgi:photosystem II stability/assembly factor-like uncharacterized protein
MESINYSEEKNYSLLFTFLSKIQKLLYNKIPIYRDYYLKILMLVFLSITIGSCYSIESDCDDGGGSFSWERTGESFYVFGVAVAMNGDIWARAYDIYLSTDNGNKWVKKSPPPYSVSKIAINPISASVFIHASSEDGIGALYRSTNNGETWEEEKLRAYVITDIFITPSGEIYLGAGRNIYYSNDNGDTWIEKSNGLNNSINCIVEGADGTLYASISIYPYGVYCSTDGGDTWLLFSNYPNVQIDKLTIADDGSIFAAAGHYGVFKSTNRGVTWTQANNGISPGYGGSYQVSEIIYNAINRDIFVITWNSGIYRSTDLGESWELKNSGLPNGRDINALAFNPNTGQMFAATGDGVYRSKNYP